MKQIASEVGTAKLPTSYWARHSFSKALLDSGQNIAYISQALNHKKITTTQNYINSLEDYNSHNISKEALLNFD